MGRGSVPLLCLGPNQFFAATESRPRVKEKDNEEVDTQTMIEEEKNESIRKKESKGVFNVMIKHINDSMSSTPDPDDIAVGGHSKMITAIHWHKESKMLATCSVDGT